MHYCMSDIHGEYEKYKKMLDLIGLTGTDTLYILGDVIDRGAEGIRVLQDMMHRSNVVPLVGNHEYMAVHCLRAIRKNAFGISARIERDRLIRDWELNGGKPTLEAFMRLSNPEQEEIIGYLGEFITYEEVKAGEDNYVLVHGGLEHFSPDRPLIDYRIDELIYRSPNYGRIYFSDRYLMTGHTPTKYIPGNQFPNRIFQANRHIAIDCGAAFGGRLGVICLETGREYYV